MTWRRPEGQFPRIWLQENGFVVRDVTPDLESYVVEQALTTFRREEVVLQCRGMATSTVDLEDMTRNWRQNFLNQRISIVALAEGEPGADLQPVGPDNPPRVLGASLLKVVHKNDPPRPPADQVFRHHVGRSVYTMMMHFASTVDCFQRFDVDHYMVSTALTVHPSVRRRGLGRLLMRARVEMCRIFHVPLTIAEFTTAGSQRIAEQTGFQLLAEIAYTDIRDENGDKMFPHDVETKTMQLRALRIQ